MIAGQDLRLFLYLIVPQLKNLFQVHISRKYPYTCMEVIVFQKVVRIKKQSLGRIVFQLLNQNFEQINIYINCIINKFTFSMRIYISKKIALQLQINCISKVYINILNNMQEYIQMPFTFLNILQNINVKMNTISNALQRKLFEETNLMEQFSTKTPQMFQI